MPALTAEDPRHCGDYDVESLLGKGSIGKVFLARHRRIGRKVALKVVRADQRFEDDDDRDDFYKRLQREAELCGAMQHPNIVTLYDVGYENDVVSWLATEYVDGETLHARLKRVRPLPFDDALSIGCDVLRGLAYAHAKGVIHRDIKPANILLTADGRAKIADFGIARRLESSLTGTNLLVGTPNYMSPEQVRSAAVTTRSDLFSAGVLLYEMLTGAKPFAAQELSSVLYNVVNLVPQPAHEVTPGIPEEVSRAVARLMAKAPAERYATAADALRDLEPHLPRPVEPELVSEELLAVSTLAAVRPAAEPPPPLSAHDEPTSPLPTFRDVMVPERSLLRRTLPLPLALGIIIALTAALVGAVIGLRRGVVHVPAATAHQAQAAETAAKRRSLEAARALANAGRFDEAVRSYDAYLARYPSSSIARAERATAQAALEESTKAAKKVTVTASKRPVAEPPAVEPPPKPPSRWERVKKWFRGK